MELIIGLITAIATLIGVVWGIVKYYDKKRTKQEAEAKAREDKHDQMLESMATELKCITRDNTLQHNAIDQLRQEVTSLNENIDTMQQQIDENEMDRLRCDIISCVNKLQNGFTMSQADFEHIHHCYDKYVGKGGNSYIESCMEYVVEYEEECRRNGIGIGFDSQPE